MTSGDSLSVVPGAGYGESSFSSSLRLKSEGSNRSKVMSKVVIFSRSLVWNVSHPVAICVIIPHA